MAITGRSACAYLLVELARCGPAPVRRTAGNLLDGDNGGGDNGGGDDEAGDDEAGDDEAGDDLDHGDGAEMGG
ncbi:MAG: hypothetical protein ACRDQX_08240 [Pseudonocardiaceae bacterium]